MEKQLGSMENNGNDIAIDLLFPYRGSATASTLIEAREKGGRLLFHSRATAISSKKVAISCLICEVCSLYKCNDPK